MKVKDIIFAPYNAIKNIITNIYIDKKIKSISINKIDAIDGVEFEKYLSLILQSINYKVITTKQSRDYGADILAKKHKETLAIQAKLYYNHNVGLSAIQEAKTASNHYNADKSVVITNSHFTKSAITLAKTTGVALIDREKLINLISTNKKNRKLLFSRYIVI